MGRRAPQRWSSILLTLGGALFLVATMQAIAGSTSGSHGHAVRPVGLSETIYTYAIAGVLLLAGVIVKCFETD